MSCKHFYLEQYSKTKTKSCFAWIALYSYLIVVRYRKAKTKTYPYKYQKTLLVTIICSIIILHQSVFELMINWYSYTVYFIYELFRAVLCFISMKSLFIYNKKVLREILLRISQIVIFRNNLAEITYLYHMVKISPTSGIKLGTM